MMEPTSLYGGALRTVLPPGFIDASSLRPIPDTQEVYVNGREKGENYGDGLGLNESITVDLLERIDVKDGASALKEHVSEIFRLIGLRNFTIDEIHQVNECTYVCSVHENRLVLCIGLIRLPRYETDVVITINVPDQNISTPVILPEEVIAVNRVLEIMLNRFEVVDDSLFV